ncbi:MAG: hypothetical protein RR415_05690 [Ruthenibacterium sp.]
MCLAKKCETVKDTGLPEICEFHKECECEKFVILSLRPQWWKLIISGEKTLEMRKTYPTRFGNRPFTVLVYECGTGKIVGQFKCSGRMRCQNLEDVCRHSSKTCISEGAAKQYMGNKPAYLWQVECVREYAMPRAISDYNLKRPPQSWMYKK